MSALFWIGLACIVVSALMVGIDIGRSPRGWTRLFGASCTLGFVGGALVVFGLS